MNSFISLLITSVCYFLGHVNTFCTDLSGTMIQDGETYSPGKNPCEMCLCIDSKPTECQTRECAIPKDCKNYVAGKECCEYTCQDTTDNKSLKSYTQQGHFLGPGIYVHLKLFGKQLIEEIKRYYYAKPKDDCVDHGSKCCEYSCFHKLQYAESEETLEKFPGIYPYLKFFGKKLYRHIQRHYLQKPNISANS